MTNYRFIRLPQSKYRDYFPLEFNPKVHFVDPEDGVDYIYLTHPACAEPWQLLGTKENLLRLTVLGTLKFCEQAVKELHVQVVEKDGCFWYTEEQKVASSNTWNGIFLRHGFSINGFTVEST